MEVERALVDAEQESEVAALQREKDALNELHSKMEDLETRSQREKEKVEYFNWMQHILNSFFYFIFYESIEILVSDIDLTLVR